MNYKAFLLTALFAMGILQAGCSAQSSADEATIRVPLNVGMIRSESELADFSGLADEQDAVGDPPTVEAKTAWKIGSQYSKQFPFAAVIDLGKEWHLKDAYIYDINNKGDVALYAGKPDEWKSVAEFQTDSYKKWKQIALNATTRYLRVELKTPGAIFSELVLTAYTEEGFRAVQARIEKEARDKAEREAALKKAQDEVKHRPVVEMAPFGKLSLVDEIDLSATDPSHLFEESPSGASRIETILGRKARVLPPTEGEAAYMSFRIGRYKMLKPGGHYVLAVEYPEDEGRSWIIQNGGNETSRGFHTGRTTGDAFHPKYVNNLNESLNIPLSGKYETWKMYFSLHDRFPQRDFIRGKGERILLPEDGFPVTVAQFSAKDIPASKGAAISRILLYEVLEPEKLKAKYTLPEGLPRRHLFWREEMADGVMESDKEEERGVKDRLDWYRYKARLMHFLGMNTYTKDLLEFGAVQGWDTSPLGGNNWAYFNGGMKDLWSNIVELMGKEGFSVLPYYEYSGSKGKQGLGPQRRAKPLTRDDGYTHIKWIESSNADITDPDTYDDFKKMLDLTVVRQKDKAEFVGIWLRPRSQLPVSFADATRARFAKEANGDKAVTRDDLKNDKALLAKYYEWWFGKRREFLTAMREYLIANGIKDPLVLYTAEASEPGAYFRGWDPRFVTDDPAFWQPIVTQPQHASEEKPTTLLTINDVVKQGLYMGALTQPRSSWGGWELHHANPESDPQRYKQTPGVLMTHPFNRKYTVADSKTFDAFRGADGRTAIVRHYALNENMMFDKTDKPKLGYFVADIERAGPYCMMGEVLAMANGDPTEIGYLSSNNFERGFPEYVRAFNTAFLSLPALPSRVVAGASADNEIVVREIPTQGHGAYYAVINTGLKEKKNVAIKLSGTGKVLNAATKEAVGDSTQLAASFGPCEMQAWWRP